MLNVYPIGWSSSVLRNVDTRLLLLKKMCAFNRILFCVCLFFFVLSLCTAGCSQLTASKSLHWACFFPSGIPEPIAARGIFCRRIVNISILLKIAISRTSTIVIVFQKWYPEYPGCVSRSLPLSPGQTDAQGQASRLKTWLYLRGVWPGPALTCDDLWSVGRDKVCAKADASFSPFGHPTQVNASWVGSINLTLANEI